MLRPRAIGEPLPLSSSRQLSLAVSCLGSAQRHQKQPSCGVLANPSSSGGGLGQAGQGSTLERKQLRSCCALCLCIWGWGVHLRKESPSLLPLFFPSGRLTSMAAPVALDL